MSSLFNKKVRRNYRNKARDSDEETAHPEHESLYEQGSKQVFLPTTAPNPETGLKKQRSVLSFEDDLDGGRVPLVAYPSTIQMME